MNLALSHYSIAKVEAVHDADERRPRGAYKPAGFWVSVDGEYDWPTWCGENDFLPKEPLLRHRVTLAESANVLCLSDPDAVLALGKKYGIPSQFWRGHIVLDWAAFAADYDGLIIAPYQWSSRLDDAAHWYYGWDCASGVIWKARAIASVECLGVADFRRAEVA